MESRKDVIDFLIFIERKYDVNKWTINDIVVWPFLRLKIFFSIIDNLENNNFKFRKKTIVNKNEFYSFLKAIISSPLLFFFFIKLKKRKYLFFDNDSQRINYYSKRYNRFFDSIISELNLVNDSYVCDFSIKKINSLFHEKIALRINYYLNIFIYLYRIKNKLSSTFESQKINLNDYERFVDLIYFESDNYGLKKLLNKKNLIVIFNDLFIKSIFFEKLIKRINPKKIFMLGYYNDIIFPLNNACFKLNIDNIDLQHGPNSDYHAAYGNWSNVPKNGYQLIPKTFWLWNNIGSGSLINWCDSNSHHRTIIYGNPWIDYIKDFRVNNNKIDYDYFLYTLQPLDLEDLFPENLLNLIRHYKYKWLIRLHPLQFPQKDAIIKFFNEEKLAHKISIDSVSEIPLPILLSNCILHISNYSGSVLESFILNKFSLILHEIGSENFKKIIELNAAIYINSTKLTISKMDNILKSSRSFTCPSKSLSFHDYFEID